MSKNARPRTATGKPLKRGDVVRNYLEDPSAADFKPKNLTHGYWAVPDIEFVMGASLLIIDDYKGSTWRQWSRNYRVNQGGAYGPLVVLLNHYF